MKPLAPVHTAHLFAPLNAELLALLRGLAPEHWHHQDQIREAVGAPALAHETWLRPVLEVSMWALPHAYRDVHADEGDAVVIEVTGDVEGAWSLVRRATVWAVFEGRAPEPRCRIVMDALAAARLLLHRLAPAVARASVAVEGEERLARPYFEARAVMV